MALKCIIISYNYVLICDCYRYEIKNIFIKLDIIMFKKNLKPLYCKSQELKQVLT